MFTNLNWLLWYCINFVRFLIKTFLYDWIDFDISFVQTIILVRKKIIIDFLVCINRNKLSLIYRMESIYLICRKQIHICKIDEIK
jgi:hypothetical protein